MIQTQYRVSCDQCPAEGEDCSLLKEARASARLRYGIRYRRAYGEDLCDRCVAKLSHEAEKPEAP